MSRMVELAEKEVMRTDILEICRQSIPIGADAQVIRAALRRSGHDASERDVDDALYYLQGRGLLELQAVDNRRLGIHRIIARITAEGIDVLDGSSPAAGVDL